MTYAYRFRTMGALAFLSLLAACGAPPRRLANEPRPAPRVRSSSMRSEAETPVVAVVAFHTMIAPGANLGGNFDDDGLFRIRESDNRMFVWGHDQECVLMDEILSILEQEAGFVALPTRDCWPGIGELEDADALLAGTLDDLTLNSFADPGRVDVEVIVAWELSDREGQAVFRKSTYGFTSLDLGSAVMFGGTVGLAVAESLRRLVAEDDFVRALRATR